VVELEADSHPAGICGASATTWENRLTRTLQGQIANYGAGGQGAWCGTGATTAI